MYVSAIQLWLGTGGRFQRGPQQYVALRYEAIVSSGTTKRTPLTGLTGCIRAMWCSENEFERQQSDRLLSGGAFSRRINGGIAAIAKTPTINERADTPT